MEETARGDSAGPAGPRDRRTGRGHTSADAGAFAHRCFANTCLILFAASGKFLQAASYDGQGVRADACAIRAVQQLQSRSKVTSAGRGAQRRERRGGGRKVSGTELGSDSEALLISMRLHFRPF